MPQDRHAAAFGVVFALVMLLVLGSGLVWFLIYVAPNVGR